MSHGRVVPGSGHLRVPTGAAHGKSSSRTVGQGSSAGRVHLTAQSAHTKVPVGGGHGVSLNGPRIVPGSGHPSSHPSSNGPRIVPGSGRHTPVHYGSESTIGYTHVVRPTSVIVASRARNSLIGVGVALLVTSIALVIFGGISLNPIAIGVGATSLVTAIILIVVGAARRRSAQLDSSL